MKFRVSVPETYIREYEVEADSPEQALADVAEFGLSMEVGESEHNVYMYSYEYEDTADSCEWGVGTIE